MKVKQGDTVNIVDQRHFYNYDVFRYFIQKQIMTHD